MRVGTIAEVWRSPVKSLRGERLSQRVAVGPAGIEGDRRALVRGRDGDLGVYVDPRTTGTVAPGDPGEVVDA